MKLFEKKQKIRTIDESNEGALEQLNEILLHLNAEINPNATELLREHNEMRAEILASEFKR